MKRFFCRLFGEAAEKSPDFWGKRGDSSKNTPGFPAFAPVFRGRVASEGGERGELAGSERQGTKANLGQCAVAEGVSAKKGG